MDDLKIYTYDYSFTDDQGEKVKGSDRVWAANEKAAEEKITAHMSGDLIHDLVVKNVKAEPVKE